MRQLRENFRATKKVNPQKHSLLATVNNESPRIKGTYIYIIPKACIITKCPTFGNQHVIGDWVQDADHLRVYI